MPVPFWYSAQQSACPSLAPGFTIVVTYRLLGTLCTGRTVASCGPHARSYPCGGAYRLAGAACCEPARTMHHDNGGNAIMSTQPTLSQTLSKRIEAVARRVRLLRAVRGVSLLVLILG